MSLMLNFVFDVIIHMYLFYLQEVVVSHRKYHIHLLTMWLLAI